ncbi:hypothetical protein WS50_08695 [Burkholderia territorii]|nr:hypothetical protein WS47_03550 [Burkholderia territorii]KUZ21049.1 hypothetical protein WS50_08695 [Burkholderia territorii]
MFGPALRDHGFDIALAQRATVSGGIVAAIGVDDARLLKRSATDTANWWNRINERQQPSDVVGVRASPDCDDGNAVGVCEDVVLGTRSRAIRGGRASFFARPRIALRTRLRRRQQWFDQYLQFVIDDWRVHPWACVVLVPTVNSSPRK